MGPNRDQAHRCRDRQCCERCDLFRAASPIDSAKQAQSRDLLSRFMSRADRELFPQSADQL
jgi:hypothetical protein